MPEGSFFFHPTTNVDTWSFLDTAGTLTGTRFYNQMRQKKKRLELFDSKHLGVFGIKYGWLYRQYPDPHC